MNEANFHAALCALPLHPGAGGLADDAARLGRYVLTTDTLVEGVHFLSTDAAADVAWKLLATNLSDLAAKGAAPVGVLLNYPIGDDDWDGAFLGGFGDALRTLGAQLLGGDTVALPAGAPRVLTLTAIGEAAEVPLRSGAQPGDALWVTGTIGDAGLGLAIARGDATGDDALLAAYRRPVPLLAEGQTLAPLVNAMMDVSDGLLIDAARMASASGLAVRVELDAVPLSPALVAVAGDGRAARLAAATAGDDYQLLFAAAADVVPPVPATRIGDFSPGAGLTLLDAGDPVSLPPRLGFLHGA